MMREAPSSNRDMRLPAWIRGWVYGSGAAALATGALWLVFHHFVRREGPFGPEAHPLEHHWLTLHGAAGYAVVWSLGLIWFLHVRRGWSATRNRLNGRALTVALIVLALTGLALYYLGDEIWRDRAAIAHWVLGFVAGVWLPLHVWSGRRTRPGGRG
ncbi:MAG: hypothetical protein ABUT39_04330 [Acidobacteriota bacterium]